MPGIKIIIPLFIPQKRKKPRIMASPKKQVLQAAPEENPGANLFVRGGCGGAGGGGGGGASGSGIAIRSMMEESFINYQQGT